MQKPETVVDTKGSIKDSDHTQTTAQEIIDQNRSVWPILFLPFNRIWEVFIVAISTLSVILTIHDIVYVHTDPPKVYIVLEFFISAAYFSDFLLALLHRHLQAVRERQPFPPRPSLHLFFDLMSALPIATFYTTFISTYSNPEQGTMMSNYLRSNNLFRVYKLRHIFTNPDHYKTMGYNELTVTFLCHFVIRCILTLLLAIGWYELRCWKCVGKDAINWTVNLEGKAFDAESEIDWLMWTFGYISGAMSHGWQSTIRAENNKERWLLAAAMFCGYVIMYGMFYGRLITVFLRAHQKHFKFTVKMAALTMQLRNWITGKELTKKTFDYYETFWNRRAGIKVAQMYLALPDTMQTEISHDVFWDALNHTHLFANMSDAFKRSLSYSLVTEFYLPGESLYMYGSLKAQMVYVVTGVIQIYSDTDLSSPIASFSSGTSFGAMSMLLPCGSSATVKCLTYCEVHVLKMRDLFCTLSRYPKLTRKILSNIPRRIEHAKRVREIGKRADESKVWHTRKAGRQQVKWVKERCRHVYSREHTEMQLTEDEDDDLEYWKIEDSKKGVDLARNSSKFIDLYTMGDKDELKHEIFCLKTTFPWIIDPDSNFLVVWQYLILLVVLVLCITMPYMIAFQRNFPDASNFMFYIINFLLALDLGIQLTTAMATKERIVTDVYGIMRHRLRQPLFLLDLAGTIPVEMFVSLIGNNDTYLYVLCKSNRLLRVFTFYRYFRTQENLLFNYIFLIRLLKYTLMILISTYWWGALMYIISCPGNPPVCVPGTWYSQYLQKEKAVVDDGFLSLKVWMFYTVQRYAGNALGELFPNNRLDITLTIITQIINICVEGYILGELISMFVAAYSTNARYRELYAEVKKFTVIRNLPTNLKARVSNFILFQWRYSNGSYMTNESDVLHDAPLELKKEIMLDEILKLFMNTQMFAGVDIDLLHNMIAIAKVYALPANAHLLTPGVHVNAFIIIRKGYCRHMIHHSRMVNAEPAVVGPGASFPSFTFFMSVPGVVSVITLTSCEIILIEHHQFNQVIKRFPNERKAFKTSVDDIIEKLGKINVVLHKPEKMYISLPIPTERKFRRKEYLKAFEILGYLQWIRLIFLKQGIHPEGKFIKYWELIKIMFVLVRLIMMPMMYNILANVIEEMQIFHYVLLAHSIMDVYVRLHVSFYTDKGLLVTHPLYTASHYLTHAFAIDVMASFPWSLLETQVTFGNRSGAGYLQLLIGVSNLLHLYRFLGFCQYYESDISKVHRILPFFRVCVSLIIFLHYGAISLSYTSCTFMFNTYIFETVNCTEESEIYNSFFKNFAVSTSTLYVYLFHYYSTVALFTGTLTGFFRIISTSMMVKYTILTLVMVFARYCFYCAFVSLIMLGSATMNKYVDRMKNFVMFMKDKEISKPLMEDAIAHFEYDWQQSKGNDMKVIISKFHLALREDLVYELYGKTFRCIHFFFGADMSFYRYLCKEITAVHYRRHASILRVNQVHENIFFINSGVVDVMSAAGSKVEQMKQGWIFGNLNGNCATYNFIATQNTEILMMKHNDFFSFLEDYPTIKFNVLRAVHVQTDYIGRTFFAQKNTDEESADKDEEKNSLHSEATRRSENSFGALKSLLTNLWTEEMKIYRYYRIFVDGICAYLSILLIMYHVSLQYSETTLLVGIYLFDVIFLTKIYVGFRTVYVDKATGVPVTDKKFIAKRYVKFWFWFDLFTCMPLEVVSYFFQKDVAFHTINEMLKINRLLRVVQPIRIFMYYFQRLNTVDWTLHLRRYLYLSAAVEVNVCLYLYLSCAAEGICLHRKHSQSDELTATSSISSAAALAHLYVANLLNKGGLSDIMLIHYREMILECAMKIFAYVMACMSIAVTASMIQNRSHMATRYYQNALDLDRCLWERDLSTVIMQKVWRHAMVLWMRDRGEYLPALLHEAPQYLRQDIMNELYGHHMRDNLLFRNTARDFATQLTAGLRLYVFFPNEYIVEKGDVQGSMCFIHEGVVEVVHRNRYYLENVLEVLKKDEVFGMAQGLYKNRQYAHIYRAKTVVTLLVLEYQFLQNLMKAFPAARKDVYDKASAIDFRF